MSSSEPAPSEPACAPAPSAATTCGSTSTSPSAASSSPGSAARAARHRMGRAWKRPISPVPVDSRPGASCVRAVGKAVRSDAVPSVVINGGFPGWAPTVQRTAWSLGRPAPHWLRMKVRFRSIGGGGSMRRHRVPMPSMLGRASCRAPPHRADGRARRARQRGSGYQGAVRDATAKVRRRSRRCARPGSDRRCTGHHCDPGPAWPAVPTCSRLRRR